MMKKKKLSLDIAIMGLDLCGKDERMCELMSKVPGLISACARVVVDYFEENGRLEQSRAAIREIDNDVDYSKCENDYGRLGTFLDALAKAMDQEEE